MSPLSVGPGINLSGPVLASQVSLGPTVGKAITIGSTGVSGAINNVPKTVTIVAEAFYYEHVQSSASALWVINHNLGKKPNISVYDHTGSEVLIPVTHVNDNTAQIDWSQPTSGRAYCS